LPSSSATSFTCRARRTRARGAFGVSRAPGRRYGEVACLTGDHAGVLQVDHGEKNVKRRGAGVLVTGAVTASSAPG